MATTPSLRARTTHEPEPDLTPSVVVHRAIRQDLRRVATCLGQIAARGVPSAPPRGLCRYTAALLAQIRANHQNQDDIIWPVLAAAAGQAVDLGPFSDDHQAIEAAVGRARKLLTSVSADPGALAALHAAVSELRDMVDDHTADEERLVFPVMRRYLRAETYRWCQRQIQRNATCRGLRFTAPWLARHTQPDELMRLMAAGGLAARIVLAATRPGYARLERQAFSLYPREAGATR